VSGHVRRVGLVLGRAGEIGLLSVHVRIGRLIVGTFPASSGYCRDVFVEVGLVSGRDRRGRFYIDTCSARSA